MGYQKVSEAEYQRVLVDQPRLRASRYRDGGRLVTEYSDPRGFVHAIRRGEAVYVHSSYIALSRTEAQQ